MRDEILTAARFHLRGWSLEQIDLGLLVADSFQSCAEAPEAIKSVCSGKDVARVERVFHALKTLLAHAGEEWEEFYRIGMPLLDSYRQSLRAQNPRRKDGLTQKIESHISAVGIIRPYDLWLDFTLQAEDGWDDVLADFDHDSNLLEFNPHPGADPVRIGYEAFRKRVQISLKGAAKLAG